MALDLVFLKIPMIKAPKLGIRSPASQGVGVGGRGGFRGVAQGPGPPSLCSEK